MVRRFGAGVKAFSAGFGAGTDGTQTELSAMMAPAYWYMAHRIATGNHTGVTGKTAKWFADIGDNLFKGSMLWTGKYYAEGTSGREVFMWTASGLKNWRYPII